MNSPSRFVEHGALISGSGAYLLSRLLRSPQVAAYIRGAGWIGGDDFAAAVHAINAASDAWQAGLELQQRQNARRYELPDSCCAMMTVEEAAECLNLSIRRVQKLAQEGSLTGRRVGRRWELDSGSVQAYRERHHQ
jgi:excisionase family DNA binding protein